ncbi:aspartate--tRNA(Asn) ligase [Candidatus Saccharibacteria bacterium CPR2]|nr:aspartate--tRNA(Asn) ligase [Candidatus Saccharibacteria bacterium CPR2]
MKNRTLLKDVSKKVGEEVTIYGWLHKKRQLGGLNFLLVRDRSGLVQMLVEEKKELEKLRGMQIGTVVEISGFVVEDDRAPGGSEIHSPKINVLSPVTDEPPIEIDKPLSHKPENLDTLFENRVIGLRNLQETKIFRIRSKILQYIRDFLNKNDFTEIQSPKIVGGAAEGGAEVFKFDYFGKEATLAQSPQLYKQIMVGVYERVYEIGPAFRAELSATTRHVCEVTMLDIEMGFIESHEDVLNLVQDLTSSVLRKIYEECSEELRSLNAPELILTDNFPRYSVTQIHELYSKATGNNTTGEKDLFPDEERWICDWAKKNDGCEAVFVTDFPIETHKFYQKINPENPNTVLSADLLFRGVEIATCPMRENNYQKMVEQMREKGIDPEDPGFSYYLQAFKYGLPPHGGCGFGIDRFTQKITGLNNIKEAILFPRDINRLTP